MHRLEPSAVVKYLEFDGSLSPLVAHTEARQRLVAIRCSFERIVLRDPP